MKSDLGTVGAYVARTHFSEILARVEKGEEITITRHGSPIARLVPIYRSTTAAQRRTAILAMRKLAARNSLAGETIKELISAGRR